MEFKYEKRGSGEKDGQTLNRKRKFSSKENSESKSPVVLGEFDANKKIKNNQGQISAPSSPF